MHRRPKLLEALNVLEKLAATNTDASAALQDYAYMLSQDNQFAASRMVVDIVDHFYHLLDKKGIAFA